MDPDKAKMVAVAERIPETVDYLTAGKRYPLEDLSEEGVRSGSITDDEGDRAYILEKGCAHLDGGSWVFEPA